MNKKLKILAAGDIHSDSRLAERLAERAEKENVDLVVLCGDLTYAESSTDGIVGPFVKRNKKVLLIPGNHESVATVDFLADFYGVTNLHGYSINYKNIGIFGCSGVNIGVHGLTEDEIFELLKKGNDRLKDLQLRAKVMVTHVHPKGVMAEKLAFVPGSEGVKKAIDVFKPDILFCSHAHEAEGIEERVGRTRIIHVGRDGKIIEI